MLTTPSLLSAPHFSGGETGWRAGLAHSSEEAGVLAGKLIVLNLVSVLSGWLSGERVLCPGVTAWP